MQRIILLIGIALGAASPLLAGNVLKEAKTAIKNRRDLDNMEKKLLEAAGKPETKQRDRAQCYYMAALVSRRINDVENEKLYLKQAYDTVKFFNSIYNMFTHFQQCDSVEAIPDKKGVSKAPSREKAREILLTYRANLLNGGKFFLQRKKYEEAFRFFDLYLASSDGPIFAKDFFMQSDTMIVKSAYWATISAYNMNQPAKTVKYVDLAMYATPRRNALQEYKAKSYQALGDTAQWVRALTEGITNFPEHAYFFISLMDYLNTTHQYDMALKFTDKMIAYNDTNPLYWYAKSVVLLATEKYDDCIVLSDTVLKLSPGYVDAYYNKGVSYCRLAQRRKEKACLDLDDPKSQADREAILALYKQARPPMENVRALLPDEPKRWASWLYEIYLNLNVEKAFDEIDRLIKSINNKG